MRELREQLARYLADAHSIEEQALAQLRRAPTLAGDPQIASALEEHLHETEEHEREIRALLDARDAGPSAVKDSVMAVGGIGFILFARAQPDTPGKLVAHAYSYEALEQASYQLLGRVATRAGDADVAAAASRICGQEEAMMRRLARLFDRAVDASLREVGSDDLHDRLAAYLADAHAIEEQAAGLLERARAAVDDPELASVFEGLLAETRRHAELVENRLDALGGDPSSLKDSLMRMGALNWNAFFRVHPDTPGKLTAFAYAFEHLEIGGYEQLKRVAERGGDEGTAATVSAILEEERSAAAKLESEFDRAVDASLQAVGVTGGT